MILGVGVFLIGYMFLMSKKGKPGEAKKPGNNSPVKFDLDETKLSALYVKAKALMLADWGINKAAVMIQDRDADIRLVGLLALYIFVHVTRNPSLPGDVRDDLLRGIRGTTSSTELSLAVTILYVDRDERVLQLMPGVAADTAGMPLDRVEAAYQRIFRDVTVVHQVKRGTFGDPPFPSAAMLPLVMHVVHWHQGLSTFEQVVLWAGAGVLAGVVGYAAYKRKYIKLAVLKSAGDLTGVIKMLADRDPEIRLAVMTFLDERSMGPGKSNGVLAQAFAGVHTDVRVWAVKAMTDVEALVRLINEPDGAVGQAARQRVDLLVTDPQQKMRIVRKFYGSRKGVSGSWAGSYY